MKNTKTAQVLALWGGILRNLNWASFYLISYKGSSSKAFMATCLKTFSKDTRAAFRIYIVHTKPLLQVILLTHFNSLSGLWYRRIVHWGMVGRWQNVIYSSYKIQFNWRRRSKFYQCEERAAWFKLHFHTPQSCLVLPYISCVLYTAIYLLSQVSQLCTQNFAHNTFKYFMCSNL